MSSGIAFSIATAFSLFAMLSAHAAPLLINGAGATFPFPLYSKWFSQYQAVDPTVEINYQSVGSGAGIRQYLDGTVDFGASDAPMKDAQLAKAKIPVIHVPTVLGAVVVTYNLPAAGSGSIRLDGLVLADIFLGSIIWWDDPRIQALNPHIKLTHTPMIVAHRSDGSGTTSIFADFLAKVSPEWKSRVGVGTALRWPVGLGGKGNEGVTGLVKHTPGAIGYIELVYAKQNQLPAATLVNAAGTSITPDLASVTAAAAGAMATLPEDFRVSLTNSPGKDAYPIAGFTYLLVASRMPKEKGVPLKRFLKWALQEGQLTAKPLNYAPLPEALVKRVRARVESIRVE